MTEHEDPGQRHQPRSPSRSLEGDRSGGREPSPGKRSATDRLPPSDPATTIVRSLDAAAADVEAAHARHLPALRTAVTERRMADARRAGAALAAALDRVDRQLASVRRWATVAGSEGALDLLVALESERDALRATAAPVLALAPPPAPPISVASAFDPFDPAVDDHLAAEAANETTWHTRLDDADAAPDNVIDARDRFGDPAAPVQLRGDAEITGPDLHAHAAAGVAGGASTLPHLDVIQASFGAHDVTGVEAHVGGRAADAARAIGAEAYATGNHVAFADAPSLFVAAHEAAHVVQQRAGVSLLGGVGVGGDRYEQHADAVAETVVRGESAAGLLGPVGGEGASTAVQRRDAKATGRLAELTRSVDFGDVPVGLPTTREIHVFNQQPTPLQIDRPTLLNDLGEYRVAAPTVAAGKSDDPSYLKSVLAEPIRVTFTPTKPGCFDNVVGFNLTDGTRSEWCAVQLYAHARAVGAASSGDHAEREARREAQEQDEKDAEGSAARVEELGAEGKKAKLEEDVSNELRGALNNAQSASDTFIERQQDGIEIEARTEIEHYERRTPEVPDSTLALIAELALVAAAAGISQGMIPMFEAAFAAKTLSRFKVWPGYSIWETKETDGRDGVRVASGMVKEVLKGLARHFAGSIAPQAVSAKDPEVATGGGASLNPVAAFLSAQVAALAAEKTRRYKELSSLHEAMRAVAIDAPAAGVAALETHALLLELNTEAARLRQIDETRLAWIRAVARGSLGTNEAGASPGCEHRGDQVVTDLDGVAQAPTERARPDAVDGLLELTFDADLARPDRPAKATSAKLIGVSQEIVTQLARMDLQAAGLPIRAVGRPARTSVSVIPIAITQDEAGTIAINGGVDYLARKADPQRGGVDAGTVPDGTQVALAHEGGRIVMEELTESTLAEQDLVIESDDATGYR